MMNKDFLRKLREEGKLELSDPIKSLKSIEMLYSMGYVFNGAEWVKSIESRTKVVYEPVNQNEEGGAYWECARDFANGVEFASSQDRCNITDNLMLLTHYENRSLCRVVEKEIDWRDEVKRYFGRDDLNDYSLGYVIDRERVDAVSKGFIGMCHLVASLTDKPE